MNKSRTGYLFILPWVIGAALFTVVPIFASLALSFTKWNMFGTPSFVGLDNYAHLFAADSGFYNSLMITLIYTLGSVIITVAISLLMAIMLNFNLKWIGIFRFLFFIPALIPSVVIARVFALMLDKEVGVVNYLLLLLGINGPDWINSETWVIPTIITMSIYTFSTGQMMLVFNSSLKEVPKDQMDAAEIDGASFFQRFWYVIVPYISPIILFNVVIATFTSLNTSFALIYPLTKGGPNEATNMLSLEIYKQAFKLFDMGYASALAMILFLIVGIIVALQFRLSRHSVHY